MFNFKQTGLFGNLGMRLNAILVALARAFLLPGRSTYNRRHSALSNSFIRVVIRDNKACRQAVGLKSTVR